MGRFPGFCHMISLVTKCMKKPKVCQAPYSTYLHSLQGVGSLWAQPDLMPLSEESWVWWLKPESQHLPGSLKPAWETRWCVRVRLLKETLSLKQRPWRNVLCTVDENHAGSVVWLCVTCELSMLFDSRPTWVLPRSMAGQLPQSLGLSLPLSLVLSSHWTHFLLCCMKVPVLPFPGLISYDLWLQRKRWWSQRRKSVLVRGHQQIQFPWATSRLSPAKVFRRIR